MIQNEKERFTFRGYGIGDASYFVLNRRPPIQGAWSGMAIVPHTSVGKVLSRASETTTANLTSFKAFSFLTDDNKNYMDGVTYSNASGEWTTDAGTFYWPVTGDLNFYSYAPENPGSEGEVTVDPSQQKITGFVPYTTAATQQDFIYSKATGNLASNGTTGIDLNFEHALSEITVAAKNDNTAYIVEVSGVKIGNIISKGDFTFPTIAGDAASWALGTEKTDYTTEWESATALTSTVSSLDASNTAFMLIPQQLEAETKAKDGSYIALKVKITMQGGQVIHDGWAYVAVPARWEMGKHYAYTLDFTSGAGQDEDGNDIISGANVKYNVTVKPWEEKSQTLLQKRYITGEITNHRLESITIDGKEYTVTGETWKFDVSHVSPSASITFGENIKSLDLSELYTYKMTSFRAMFNNCRYLKTANLSGWDTHNITTVGIWEMFVNCSSLTSLDLSGWNLDKVFDEDRTSGAWDHILMFNGCKKLSTIYMEGCSEKTIAVIKHFISRDGLSDDIIKVVKN